MNEKHLQLIAAVLLCTTIISGASAVQYNYKYSQLKADYDATLNELDTYSVLVDLMVNNGETIVWFNETRVKVGSSLLDVSDSVLEIDYQFYDFGVMVTGIDGVNADSSHFWGWNIYEDGWVMGMVAADQFTVHDGDILAWTYTSFE